MNTRSTPTPPASHATGISRRALLAGGALFTGAGVAALAAPRIALGRSQAVPGAPAASTPAGAGPRPRNLILLVADGMAAGTLALADQYLRHTTGRPSAWRRLTSASGPAAPRHSLCCVDSADSLVTDSAAASSAWSVGVKHNNGSLCVAPDGSRPEPYFIRAKRSGKRTGAVTTTTITHATPGGFYANCPDRNQEAIIAAQLVERGLDIALGGGAKFFPQRLLDSAPDLAGGFATTAEQLAAIAADPAHAGRRILGVFNSSHLSHALERKPTEPSLPDMARLALDRLSATTPGTDGFVLQIEGGRVDHAAHRNDAAALLHEQLEFDRTLDFVAQWTAARNDTLLVVTTDHATGNPGLCFYGRQGRNMLSRMTSARHSFEWALAQLDAQLPPVKGKSTDEQLAARAALLGTLLEQATTVRVDQAGRDQLAQALAGKRVETFEMRSKITSVMGVLVGNELGVGFLSQDHTGDYVELLAMGAGSDALPGFMDNTELHHWLVASMAMAR